MGANWVTKVKYVRDYLLQITFNNGETKIVDMEPYVGGDGVFKPLQDIEYFKTVKLDSAGNTICWENGCDMCPDVLYQIGKASAPDLILSQNAAT